MGLHVTSTTLANPPGQTTKVGQEHTIEEVTQPLVRVTSDMGDLGGLLFHHDITHFVPDELTDPLSVVGPNGGAVKAGKNALASVNQRADRVANATSTELADVANNTVAGSGVVEKKANPLRTVSLGDFGAKAKSDLAKLGSKLRRQPASS